MYKLPNLPYSYQDLESYIDTHTIGIHYHFHAQNYLSNLNKILKENNYNYKYNLTELIYHINEFNEKDRENLLFNLGGVINHNLYWKSMNNPTKVQKPYGNLLLAIEKNYGSFDNFYETFKVNALKLKGSGYTLLVLKNNGELDIINMSNQQTPILFEYIPLFTIDMWEHAYYLNYQFDKTKYLDNFKIISDFTNANKIYNSISNNNSSYSKNLFYH